MTESGIGEKEIDLRIKNLKEDAKKRGYNLNPDELLVRELVSGILINKKRYGFESCPCRLTIGKKEDNDETILRVSVECKDPEACDKKILEKNITESILKKKPELSEEYSEGYFRIIYNFAKRGGLEFQKIKGRPKRLVDRR